MARILQLAGLAIGLAGLLLQFGITIPASMAAGRSFVGSLVFFFSFFTILTNIAVVLVHLAGLTGRPGWFAQPRVRAGVAVAIAVVSIVYATVLARLWQPQGLMLVCDITLHYVTPILFVAWWMVAGADGSTRWRDLRLWLAYPLIYLAYALARAPIAGEVPYPFLSVANNGVGGVALASLLMLGLYLLIAALALLYDRLVGASRATSLA
jgi:hypothetical protein